jgi:hypothetical protein
MSTAIPDLRTPQPNAANSGTTLDGTTIATWVTASMIAAFFALIVSDSAIVGDAYIPRGNDSMYHARRILDAAIGSRGFYQFDDRLHAPDGAWIPWPWAYDYLLALATKTALWVRPSLDPMTVMMYAPVAWIFVNAALFLAVARAVGLSREMRILAMMCFALSPLTLLLHAIGMIDHHYIEHTFVLLSVWLGLRWFSDRNNPRRAMMLAMTLGVATAFHSGLFVLQLLVILTVVGLWLRDAAPEARVLWAFGITLVAATLIALLPSEPFRKLMFEFGLHSWFHLYVAVCTASALAFMGWRRFNRANFIWLAALCSVLLAPLAAQIASSLSFVSGSFSILDQIAEVQSPYRLLTTLGPMETVSYYSWLLLLAPVSLVYYGFQALREVRPERLYYAVAVSIGLTLLLMQLRLQYFGFFALVTSVLLFVDQLRTRRAWHRGLTFVATFGLLVLAYQPSLRNELFAYYPPSSSPEYASAFPLFLELGAACEKDPGVVLASADDGNAILFHSNCSVIANNFILRREDEQHIGEIRRLLQLSPAQIAEERPDIKYILVRVRDFSVLIDGVAHILTEIPLAKELLVDETPPPGYTAIMTVQRRIGEDGVAGTYAKLFKVTSANAGTAPL